MATDKNSIDICLVKEGVLCINDRSIVGDIPLLMKLSESYDSINLAWASLYELKPKDFDALCLSVAKPLKSLDLSHNFIETFTQKVMINLCLLIRQCKPEHLNLSGFFISKCDYKWELLTSLIRIPRLSKLTLSKCELGTNGGCLKELLRALSYMKLKVLDISDNEFWRLNQDQWQKVVDYIGQSKLKAIHFHASDLQQMPTNAKNNLVTIIAEKNIHLKISSLNYLKDPLLIKADWARRYNPALFNDCKRETKEQPLQLKARL